MTELLGDFEEETVSPEVAAIIDRVTNEIAVEYERPPDSFTIREYASRTGKPFSSTSRLLRKMEEDGKLKGIFVKNSKYYVIVEK